MLFQNNFQESSFISDGTIKTGNALTTPRTPPQIFFPKLFLAEKMLNPTRKTTQTEVKCLKEQYSFLIIHTRKHHYYVDSMGSQLWATLTSKLQPIYPSDVIRYYSLSSFIWKFDMGRCNSLDHLKPNVPSESVSSVRLYTTVTFLCRWRIWWK